MSAPNPRTVDLAGIFVGGESKRMGGRPKGLLVAPSGETIVERWLRMFRALGVPTVLVGRRDPYASLGVEIVDDEQAGIGPRRRDELIRDRFHKLKSQRSTRRSWRKASPASPKELPFGYQRQDARRRERQDQALPGQGERKTKGKAGEGGGGALGVGHDR